MATKAEQKRVRFKAKAVALGYNVTRTRPFYIDAGGTSHPATTVTYSALDDPQREIKERVLQQMGLDNQKNDGFKMLLFPWDADVREGDELKMSNTIWTYNVTKADSPFQIGSEVVYWQVQATRKVR